MHGVCPILNFLWHNIRVDYMAIRLSPDSFSHFLLAFPAKRNLDVQNARYGCIYGEGAILVCGVIVPDRVSCFCDDFFGSLSQRFCSEDIFRWLTQRTMNSVVGCMLLKIGCIHDYFSRCIF